MIKTRIVDHYSRKEKKRVCGSSSDQDRNYRVWVSRMNGSHRRWELQASDAYCLARAGGEPHINCLADAYLEMVIKTTTSDPILTTAFDVPLYPHLTMFNPF